jgi:hypothetical protein
MLSLSAAIVYGAVGGLITEAIVMLRWLESWRQARHEAVMHRKRRPVLTNFIDPVADPAVALTRAGLGAVVGWLLHDQLTGVYAALTVGASAPAVLAALGRAVTPAGALAGRQHGGLARPPESEQGHQPEMAE